MILYFIKEAFRSIRRSKLASFITVISISLAIFATTLSVILVGLSSFIERELKERIEIDIFLAKDISQDNINLLRNELRGEEIVQRVSFVSTGEAQEKFIRETGEDFRGVLEVNPLPPSFNVSFKKDFIDENVIDGFINRYTEKQGVDEVIYDYSTIISVINIVNSSRLIIFFVSVLLIILAVYLVYSTNRLQIQNKIEQFNTMKLVGAKLNAMRIPLYVTGIILGLIASLICVIISYFSITLIERIYYNLNFLNYFYFATLLIIILGQIFGFSGSYITSRKISLKIDRFN